MAKKPTTNVNVDNDVMRALADTQRMLEMLRDSPAFNGGFTVLMNKIDAMQETQNQLTSKVEDIHEAIYNPDEGIYARIKNSATVEAVQDVEKKVETLEIWRVDAEKEAASLVETHDTVRDHTTKIESLVKLKDSTVDIAKKVALGLAGAAFTLICKVVYTLVTGHLHIP